MKTPKLTAKNMIKVRNYITVKEAFLKMLRCTEVGLQDAYLHDDVSTLDKFDEIWKNSAGKGFKDTAREMEDVVDKDSLEKIKLTFKA